MDATAIPAPTIPRRFSLHVLGPLCAPFLNKRAQKSALMVHDLIIGHPAHKHPRPQLKHLKSQLIPSKSANKVIAHLRALPTQPQGPIHAVCLAHPDAQVQKLHFSAPDDFLSGLVSLDQVSSILGNIDVINLIGIGEPGNGKGLLAGAVPTAETVWKGFQEITPQLMALGYATGKSVLIDHTGESLGKFTSCHANRVLQAYWWGLELVFPSPSLQHLASAHSITQTILNFLTALSLLSGGIRELLPFIRYIAQFVDSEFDDILKQDRGRGVVCASTWIMPAALVARAWDFQEPPPEKTIPTTPVPATPSADNAPPLHTTPSPPPPPTGIVANLANTIIGAYKDSVTFQPEMSAASSVPA
ncbi:hypothetical protein C0989_005909 [Termitomyces sp. Mn162]|nr:hypothetical protein C0989_005909 [Termitomyces sp. Mn162]